MVFSGKLVLGKEKPSKSMRESGEEAEVESPLIFTSTLQQQTCFSRQLSQSLWPLPSIVSLLPVDPMDGEQTLSRWRVLFPIQCSTCEFSLGLPLLRKPPKPQRLKLQGREALPLLSTPLFSDCVVGHSAQCSSWSLVLSICSTEGQIRALTLHWPKQVTKPSTRGTHITFWARRTLTKGREESNPPEIQSLLSTCHYFFPRAVNSC